MDADPPIAWEDAACPLCAGHRRTTLIAPLDALPCRVVRCRDCGLAYTHPRPRPASIAALYPEDYTPHQPREKPSRRCLLANVLGPPGRVLDFGCGAGALLRQLHRRGWRVTGLDLSPHAVRRCANSWVSTPLWERCRIPTCRPRRSMRSPWPKRWSTFPIRSPCFAPPMIC